MTSCIHELKGLILRCKTTQRDWYIINQLKINMDAQSTWITKTIRKEQKNNGGITFPDIKFYCKDMVIKTMWEWHMKQ